MTKQHAYISMISPRGTFRNIKVLITSETEHKIRNLKAGSITTFHLQENDGFINGGDLLVEDTLTVYPANLAFVQVKIVESEDG